ncbi:MAG: WD40 repeat domain-containing protein, partial [Candidatus Poribacteria bacterium]|nr:WD40 repeat domain-containing protein [Candidatus Poribacteria bacterium]
MKTRRLSILTLFLLSTLFSLHISAEDYTQWGLPKGAKARLGKGSIRKLAYTPDGNQLLVASSIGIWTYDADTMETLGLLNSTRFSNGDVVFSPDRRLFATRRGDREKTAAHLWNRIQRQHITNLKGHTRYIESLDFSPDGNTLATGSSDHTARLWDTTTGEHKMTLAGHTETVTSVAFSPDGKTLATGSWDETVRLWDTTTGEHKTLLTNQSGEGIHQLVFSPDGETLAILFYNTVGVLLWDLKMGERKKRLGTNRNIACIAFSPDSRKFAGGGWSELYLWDINTEERTTLTGHLEEVISVTFSPDGKKLASASADELHLWNSATGAQTGTITGHTQYIRGFAVSADGHTIATGNTEKIRLWDTVNRAEKSILYEDDWGNDNLAFSP